MLLILVFHALPTLAIFSMDRALVRFAGPGLTLKLVRTVGFATAVLVFLRQVQIGALEGIGASNAIVILGAMTLVTVAAFGTAWTAHRLVTTFFLYLAPISGVLTAVFVVQAGLLGAVWQEREPTLARLEAVAETAEEPVFIIIFDALSRDILIEDGEVDPELFPAFAALAADSVTFTNATTNYPNTGLAIPSMVTGRFVDLRAHVANSCFESLLDCEGNFLAGLASQGFDVTLYRDNPCPVGGFLCSEKSTLIRTHPQLLLREAASVLFRDILIPRSISDRMPWLTSSIFPSNYLHIYSKTVWASFVDGISATDSRGVVHYVHLILPHDPFEFDREGRRRPAPDGWDVAAYTDQVGFVDTLLGDFIDTLKSEGIYEDSTILITGDHGPRSILGLPESPFPITLAVPLFVHAPGLAPGLNGTDYQHIDFKPTLYDVLGVDVETSGDGVSAFAEVRPSRPKVMFLPDRPTLPESELVPYWYDSSDGMWHRQG